jgi:hypothetical protein
LVSRKRAGEDAPLRLGGLGSANDLTSNEMEFASSISLELEVKEPYQASAVESGGMPELFLPRGTTPLSSLVDQWTELYVFVDDFLVAHPNLLRWRPSPHHTPALADSAVLTLALLPGGLGVASRKPTYRLVAANYRFIFPRLCSDQPWMARRQALTGVSGALLQATTQQPGGSAAFYLMDAQPLPVCHPVRPRRVRLLRQEGAWFGKTSQGLVLWLSVACTAPHRWTHPQSGADTRPRG